MSGYKVSAKVIEQREKAARKHGAYAFQARGEAALEPEKRSRLAELNQAVQDRPGLVALLQDRAIKAVMVCELLESHVSEEARAGKKPSDITALRSLPAYWNSAQRCINALLAITPEEPEGTIDLEELRRQYGYPQRTDSDS